MKKIIFIFFICLPSFGKAIHETDFYKENKNHCSEVDPIKGLGDDYELIVQNLHEPFLSQFKITQAKWIDFINSNCNLIVHNKGVSGDYQSGFSFCINQEYSLRRMFLSKEYPAILLKRC